eukprot:GHRR01001797.1.p1 GENE.GHRR01001797.1~~GHRR01001797.1.p1  ORF type:complete len:273 (+),score=56.48 GHRR01001797.1:400-1218(+)
MCQNRDGTHVIQLLQQFVLTILGSNSCLSDDYLAAVHAGSSPNAAVSCSCSEQHAFCTTFGCFCNGTAKLSFVGSPVANSPALYESMLHCCCPLCCHCATTAVVTPRLVDRVINPLINWLQRSLTLPQIGGVIFVGIAILPFTLVISSIPLVWLAGIIFDFWVALGIVMAAAFVGMSGQFWLARYVLHDRVQRLVAAHTYKWVSVAFRAIESAGPWKVTLLLRLGPFPYSYLNYLLVSLACVRCKLAWQMRRSPVGDLLSASGAHTLAAFAT